MTNEEQDQLEDEVRLACQAQSAYDGYVKYFIKQQKEYCHNQFKEITCTCTTDLVTIKYLLDSITHLENSILSDMETGKLAKIQLENNND